MNHKNGRNGLVKRTKLRKNRAKDGMHAAYCQYIQYFF